MVEVEILLPKFAIVVNNIIQEVGSGIEHSCGSHVPVFALGFVAVYWTGLEPENFGRPVKAKDFGPFGQHRTVDGFARAGGRRIQADSDSGARPLARMACQSWPVWTGDATAGGGGWRNPSRPICKP